MEPNYAPATPRKRSWPKYLGIGCLVVIVLLAVGGVLAFYGIRSAVENIVARYSSERPLTLPEAKIPETQVAALEDRIRSFGEALDEGKPAEPLTLSEDEINALIQRGLSRSRAGRDGANAYVRVVGSTLEADVTFPLRSTFGSEFGDRYFNGKARVSTEVVDGRLEAYLEDLKVGDDYVPDQLRERLRRRNLLRDVYDDPEARRFLTRLESIEIGSGKVTLKPKPITAR